MDCEVIREIGHLIIIGMAVVGYFTWMIVDTIYEKDKGKDE